VEGDEGVAVWLVWDLAAVAGLWLTLTAGAAAAGLWMVLAAGAACLWLIGFVLGLGLVSLRLLQAMGLTRSESTTIAASSNVHSFAAIVLLS
jgi:hypothetical protein